MTVEKFYAIVHKLRLTQTPTPTVWLDEEMCPRNVPLPNGRTPDQIRENAEQLIKRMGRSLDEFFDD